MFKPVDWPSYTSPGCCFFHFCSCCCISYPHSSALEQSSSLFSYLSLNSSVILSQATTLPCFYLSHLSSRICSHTLLLFPLMFSLQLHTLPNQSTVTTFRSLYPPLTSLTLQLVCVTECSATAHSHWQLTQAGAGGGGGKGDEGKNERRKKKAERDRPSSPWWFPPALSEEVSATLLWCRQHHAEVWSCECLLAPFRLASLAGTGPRVVICSKPCKFLNPITEYYKSKYFLPSWKRKIHIWELLHPLESVLMLLLQAQNELGSRMI